jgi:hypothetical protein
MKADSSGQNATYLRGEGLVYCSGLGRDMAEGEECPIDLKKYDVRK